MSWLFRHNWAWSLAAFLLGALITWLLLDRRTPAPAEEHAEEPAKEEALVGAASTPAPATRTKPARPEPAPAQSKPGPAKPQPEQAKPAPITPAEPAPEPDESPTPEPAAAQPEPITAAAPASEPVEPAAPTPEPEQVPAAPATKSAVPEPEPTVLVEPEPAPVTPEPEPAAPVATAPPAREDAVPSEGEFSRLMGSGDSAAPTLFDDEVPVGRFGPGSADAVPHQGPPDGFTIKGNAQSMLFHTPDSPYYGRTKAEVWFRSEADAERSGFTKYVRKPRKSTQPGN